MHLGMTVRKRHASRVPVQAARQFRQHCRVAKRQFRQDIAPGQHRARIIGPVRPDTAAVRNRDVGPRRIADRKEMARILGWSESKLDRRTSEKAIPSILDGGRRSYVIGEVIAALKAQTAEEEVAAARRQAAKQAAKEQNRKGAADA